ncbi:SLC2A8 (predicted) [Pycnogonum litorale]
MEDKSNAANSYGSNADLNKNRAIRSSSKLYFAAFSVWLGSVTMGSVIAYTSPAIPLMEKESSPVHITRNEADWVGSLSNIGALIAGPTAGYLIEKIGRKSTLFYVNIPFIVGYLLIAYAKDLGMLLIGRVLTGFCSGIIALSVPVYIGEISPPSVRGCLGTIIQLSVVFGIVCTYTVGMFVPWTWLAFFCTLWPTSMLMMMMIVPETPFWLVRHGEKDAAMKSIQFLRGRNYDASLEYAEILDVTTKLNSFQQFSLSSLKQPTIYKPLLISLVIMFTQQFCGINAIMFYTVSIFKHSGSSIDPNLATILVGLAQFVGTAVASIVMDKLGRRILLIFSGLGSYVFRFVHLWCILLYGVG